ncbi:30 kDa ribonucleoprotein chloroplastic [Phtheirospermum japonicum]|uniref:30 kDa ribonucleoprotein chloroplastic n=1 Tax=Phtheirospermum japonicum TaxID=374723 RepID=A0A830B7V5_9LAMI|nr:30 kDa ribonucleoprotein chloroplastic [Phtheirospermum japonicum]
MAASSHFLSLTPKTLSLHRSSAAASSALFAPCSLKTLSKLSLSLSSIKNQTHSIHRFIPKVSVSSELETDLEEEGEGEGEYEDEPMRYSEDLKVFVGNLPFSVDSDLLAGLFKQVGDVELVEVVFDKTTGRSRGFAFVVMSTPEEAKAAAQQLNGYVSFGTFSFELGGRPLRVNYGPPPPKRENSSFRGPRGGGGGGERSYSDDTNKLYVGNLSWDVDNSALENMFRKQGDVKEARVVFDRESGRSRGFGFVTYCSRDEANNAIEALDGANFNGRPIRVSLAEARPPRQY